MLKKTIEYVDFDGNERKEDFYFHLSKAEATQMELGISGGLTKMIQKIVQEQNSGKIVEVFKDLIMKTYGEKSLDGKFFIKERADGSKPALEFAQTEAFTNLYMEMLEDPKVAAAFFNGVISQEKPAPNPIPPGK